MGKKRTRGWPANGKPASFRLLVSSCKKALMQGMEFRRINAHKNIKWEGPIFGEFPKALTAQNLKYDLEEQGRDLVDVVLGIAVQLGIEQGRRMAAKDIETKLKLIEMGLSMGTSALEKLKRSHG